MQSRLAALDLPTPVTVNITLAPKTAGAAEDFDDHAPGDHRRYPSLAGCVCRKLLGKGGSDLDEPHERQVPFAIATSGARHTAGSALALLGLPDDVPVVTRDLVERAKPDPHLFLAAARRLGVDPAHCFVVGDSVWDLLAAQRAGALGIGLLSGGYGREELERSGAYRVYADPAEMLTRLEEVGVRPIR